MWWKVWTVKEGLAEAWLCNCGPNLGEDEVAEFLLLLHALAYVQFYSDREDLLVWGWTVDRKYFAKFTYNVFSAGRELVEGATQSWRSRAPYNLKLFAWLAPKT